MTKTTRIIRSMDGPIRVLEHLTNDLRVQLDKTARDLQEEFPIIETGIEFNGASSKCAPGGRRSKSRI